MRCKYALIIDDISSCPSRETLTRRSNCSTNKSTPSVWKRAWASGRSIPSLLLTCLGYGQLLPRVAQLDFETMAGFGLSGSFPDQRIKPLGKLFELRTTTTDANGAFVIENLPAGEVFVSASQSRSSGDSPVDVHIREGSWLGVREHRWQAGPDRVRLAPSADHFVRMTARRVVN